MLDFPASINAGMPELIQNVRKPRYFKMEKSSFASER